MHVMDEQPEGVAPRARDVTEMAGAARDAAEAGHRAVETCLGGAETPVSSHSGVSPTLARGTMPAAGRGVGGNALRLGLLLILALCCATAFLLIGIEGDTDFVLQLRLRKLATFLLVAWAIGVSTVLFQTATENRILTPAVMGFDALYVLLQSCMIFFLGGTATISIDATWMFLMQVGIMLLFAALLYRVLFVSGRRSLHQLVLAGVVLGVLFRSLNNLILRMIDPNEFLFLQDRMFASFNNPDHNLLLISCVTVLLTSVWALRSLQAYDVLALGREIAINLGVDQRRLVSRSMMFVAVLISVSTALVGPVTFFGLLVAHLAYQSFRSHRHSLLLPAVSLIGFICLTAGQMMLEHLFGFETNLRVVIDFFGGLLFILLLVRGASR